MTPETTVRRSRIAFATALLLMTLGVPTLAHAQATVTIAASDAAASEVGLDPGQFTVTRSGGNLAQALTVTVTIGGTATNGGDYAGITAIITILANESTATRAITPVGDNRIEGGETVVLTIAPDAAYTVGAASSDTVTIADNPATVTLAATDAAASEVDLAAGEFTVTRSGGNLAQPLTVTLTIGGTAANGADYAGITIIITILANETTATRAITPLGDNRIEGAETVVLAVAASADASNGYQIGALNTDTVTIADDPATVTLAATDAAASEVGLAAGEFAVTRSGGYLAQPLTVTLTIGGTAANGGDYAGITIIITILANETTATRAITPLGDNRIEGAETVVLAVAASADASNGYQIGAPNTDTVTIADDPATVTLVATDAAASEVGLDAGEFTVTRSGGNLAQPLTVTLTIGGTAANGSDYAGIPSTITILAGETTATRAITPLSDGNPGEGAETVVLTVAASGDASNGYQIGAATTDTVTIADDAATPTPTTTPSRTATPTPAGTAPPLPTATATPATTAADPFMIYALATSAGAPGLVPLGPLVLADRFRTAGYDVVKRGGLFAPADRNGSGTSDPDTHLLEYRVKAAKGDPRFSKRFDVPAVNACSDVLLQLTKPVSFLMPAARSSAGPIGAPAPTQHERDHYLCYAAKVQKTRSNGAPLPKRPKRQQVVVEDQFQTRRYDLKAITKLCQPTAVSGSPVVIKGPNAGQPVVIDPAPIRHPSGFLVCYRATAAAKAVTQTGCVPIDPADKGTKILPKQPKHAPLRDLHVATALGALRVDTKKEIELCIPSTSP